MTGVDLINYIQNNGHLLHSDIDATFKSLLKERLINPSKLIDAQYEMICEERDRYKCHFVESDTCNYLILEGNKEQKAFGKIRAKYNSKFNTSFPTNYKLTDEELKERKEFFELLYGFNPEE